jgi:hypothetical protein
MLQKNRGDSVVGQASVQFAIDEVVWSFNNICEVIGCSDMQVLGLLSCW